MRVLRSADCWTDHKVAEDTSLVSHNSDSTLAPEGFCPISLYTCERVSGESCNLLLLNAVSRN